MTAVDTDPAALVATTANAARNGVQGVVVIGDVGSGGLDDLVEVFDVVLANVPTPTVIDLASAMARRLAPGGRVVVTGFLTAREVAVVAAFVPAAPLARSERDGWACVVLGAANRP